MHKHKPLFTEDNVKAQDKTDASIVLGFAVK